MDAQQHPLKIFIPYLVTGHMNLLYDIATLFASCGQHMTIITTPSTSQTLLKSLPSADDPTFLHLHTVNLPTQQVGLSNGIESLSSVTNFDNCAMLHRASMLLREPITRFLKHHQPDCNVSNFMILWVEDVATKLQIPRLTFNCFSFFFVCKMESLKAHPLPKSHSGPSIVPNFPHHITMCTMLPKMFTEFMDRLLDIGLKSYALIANSLVKLEVES